MGRVPGFAPTTPGEDEDAQTYHQAPPAAYSEARAGKALSVVYWLPAFIAALAFLVVLLGEAWRGRS